MLGDRMNNKEILIEVLNRCDEEWEMFSSWETFAEKHNPRKALQELIEKANRVEELEKTIKNLENEVIERENDLELYLSDTPRNHLKYIELGKALKYAKDVGIKVLCTNGVYHVDKYDSPNRLVDWYRKEVSNE